MRIKFVSKTPVDRMEALWRPLVPEGGFARAEFTFDPDDRDYDFLAVYEDLPPRPGERKILRSERLACDKDNTLLITTEPSSIRLMGPNYLSQFGKVWTSVDYGMAGRDPDTGLIVNERLYKAFNSRQRTGQVHQLGFKSQPPPLRWFYGRDFEGADHMTVTEIARTSPEKSADLSTVTSDKAMAHTVHAARLSFVQALSARMGGELALFGRGFQEVRDKAEAMAPFRYHLAIENHVQRGHHTEKLTDCFLAECLPFYFGDPGYNAVYPREAVIPIDITDLDAAERIIRDAIATQQWEKRLPLIRKAKARALHRSNPVAQAMMVAGRLASCEPAHDAVSRGQDAPGSPDSSVIHGRHAFRRTHPLLALQDAAIVARLRRTALANPLQGLPALRKRVEAV